MNKDTSKVFESLTSLVVVIVLMAGTVVGWAFWGSSKEKVEEPAKQALAVCANTKDIVMKQMCSE